MQREHVVHLKAAGKAHALERCYQSVGEGCVVFSTDNVDGDLTADNIHDIDRVKASVPFDVSWTYEVHFKIGPRLIGGDGRVRPVLFFVPLGSDDQIVLGQYPLNYASTGRAFALEDKLPLNSGRADLRLGIRHELFPNGDDLFFVFFLCFVVDAMGSAAFFNKPIRVPLTLSPDPFAEPSLGCSIGFADFSRRLSLEISGDSFLTNSFLLVFSLHDILSFLKKEMRMP